MATPHLMLKCRGAAVEVYDSEYPREHHVVRLPCNVKQAAECRLQVNLGASTATSALTHTDATQHTSNFIAILLDNGRIRLIPRGRAGYYDVDAPFGVSSMHPLEVGLLVKSATPYHEGPALAIEASSRNFILMHPLGLFGRVFSPDTAAIPHIDGSGAHIVGCRHNRTKGSFLAVATDDDMWSIYTAAPITFNTQHVASDRQKAAAPAAPWFKYLGSNATARKYLGDQGVRLELRCNVPVKANGRPKNFFCVESDAVVDGFYVIAMLEGGVTKILRQQGGEANTLLHDEFSGVHTILPEEQLSVVVVYLNGQVERRDVKSATGTNIYDAPPGCKPLFASFTADGSIKLTLNTGESLGDITIGIKQINNETASPADTALLLDVAAHRSGFLGQPAGKGLGVLIVQGTTGKPTSEIASAAAGAASVLNAILGTGDCAAGAGRGDDADGLVSISLIAPHRADRRFRSLARLLRSSKPGVLPLPEAGAEDQESTPPSLLALFRGRRTMSQAFGRGMLTAATMLPSFIDPLRVPILTIAARSPQHGTLHCVDISAISTVTSGITEWAEFANGMATALRLPSFHCVTHIFQQDMTLIRSWIKSHRYTGVPPDLAAIAATTATLQAGFGGNIHSAPLSTPGTASGIVPPNATHAGLMMGLGMQGYLRCLNPTDIIEYLSHTHTSTTIGFLLGLAASFRSTMDPAINKSIILHLPALLAGFRSELEIPTLVQSCAIIALGILYEGTADAQVSEFLFSQVARLPIFERSDADKEAYSAAAGYALGITHLGKGPIDIEIVEAFADGNSYQEGRICDALVRYFVGGYDANIATRLRMRRKQMLKDPMRPSLVRAAPMIYTMLAAPPAIIATMLSCLKTNNEAIARMLALPDSLYLLDEIRYDCIMLRSFGHGLVMWDECTPFEGAAPTAGFNNAIDRAAWDSQRKMRVRSFMKQRVPPVIRRTMRRIYARGVHAASGGAAAALLAKILGNTAKHANTKPMEDPVDEQDGDLERLDESYIKTAYWMSLSGTCAAMACRFAGTGDRVIRDELLSHLLFLALMKASGDKANYQRIARFVEAVNAEGVLSTMHGVKNLNPRSAANSTDGTDQDVYPGLGVDAAADDLLSPLYSASQIRERIQPGRAAKQSGQVAQSVASSCSPSQSVLMSAISTVSIAVGIVMAGTADTMVLGVLRELRKHLDRNTTYGDFMANGCAIGLLGLSAGRATLSRSDSSVAALVTLLMPVWPHGSANHMQWPQAARQLWPHALDMRCLRLVNSRDRRDVDGPVRIRLRDGTCLVQRAPCLLPELHLIEAIDIHVDRYEATTLVRDRMIALCAPDEPGDGRARTPIVVPLNELQQAIRRRKGGVQIDRTSLVRTLLGGHITTKRLGLRSVDHSTTSADSALSTVIQSKLFAVSSG